MNQGKLEVVKQEMPSVNVKTLGISELKWTEMGEFDPLGYLDQREPQNPFLEIMWI